MPILTHSELAKKLWSGDAELIHITKSYTVPSGNPTSHSWDANGIPEAGTAPTTAAVPDRTTTGAIGQRNKAGGADRRYCAVRTFANTLGDGLTPSSILLVDRLSHQGGLSGNVNTSQTTNLPTAALTRFTSGVGVWAALDIYTAIGNGGTTVSGVYTNSAGTGSRVFVDSPFGVTSWQGAKRTHPLPLQAGDRGVRSVESIQLATASGTVGNFGVTLYKTLGIMHYGNSQSRPFGGDPIADLGPLFEVPTDACLAVLALAAGQTATLIEAELVFFDVTDP